MDLDIIQIKDYSYTIWRFHNPRIDTSTLSNYESCHIKVSCQQLTSINTTFDKNVVSVHEQRVSATIAVVVVVKAIKESMWDG